MIYKRPLRFTTLHFEQRFLIDDDTFILLTPNGLPISLCSQKFDYTCQCTYRLAYQGTVNISGSPSVIATECSQWAVSDPSADATVHWSGKTRV